MITEMRASDVAQGERFEFGKNWSVFFDREKIKEAEYSLKKVLRFDPLEGGRFWMLVPDIDFFISGVTVRS